MDFKIKTAHPDGISIRVEFWAETWDDVATLMRHLDRTDTLLNRHGEVL